MTTPLDYPLPQHAAYIWTNGEKIILTFPGYESSDNRRFNSVVLNPKDPQSMAILWDVLKHRANTELNERRNVISQKGCPTQAQLDEMIKAMKKPPAPKAREVPTDFSTFLDQAVANMVAKRLKV